MPSADEGDIRQTPQFKRQFELAMKRHGIKTERLEDGCAACGTRHEGEASEVWCLRNQVVTLEELLNIAHERRRELEAQSEALRIVAERQRILVRLLSLPIEEVPTNAG